MAKYNPEKIEKKWQKYWQKHGTFTAAENPDKTKKYILVEFPYPSGAGLHSGHLRPFVAADVTSRYYRANNFEVMFPFGWDAFGLPAENYAIKMGVKPEISTAQNIKNARRQVNAWGISFDWSREVNTTDPEYYKWTQWIFLQFFKAGLAYEATALLNWCPKDKTVLANEEVIDGKCERCGSVVEKREMRQWFLKITDYAQKLIDGLRDLDWPESVKQQQENWIGRSEGAEIPFRLETAADTGADGDGTVTVFTTRPDTLFGATYIVLAPEHQFVQKLRDAIENWDEVSAYVETSKHKTDIVRSDIGREKTGVQLKGISAINPATGEKIPVWLADYVLVSYGTGAIMAVPAHDERDAQFAKKYALPVREVVGKSGNLVNSGEFDGLPTEQAHIKITKKFGKEKITYRLRDWVFSRQRYWGEPIPIIHCPKDGAVAVPEDQLPVELPKIRKYEPTGTGESPLAGIESWVNVKCPVCGGPARRETNTMPQWAGSSWYYLRYTDPDNAQKFAAADKMKYWLPVDIYFGGMEHTTLHLLYSRFWNLFLYDQGLVPVKEPYARRQPHGIILGPDGEKMSKSRGNVVNPDDIVAQYGADTLRMYQLFLGPHEQVVAWNDKGIIGVRRFLERAWKFAHANSGKAQKNPKKAAAKTEIAADVAINSEINRLTKRVTENIRDVKFNTAVSAFMEFLNAVGDARVGRETLEKFLVLLNPFAPHLAEELWEALGHEGSIAFAPWPAWDAQALVADTVTFVIQVGGKLRGNIEMPKGAPQADVEAKAKELKTVVDAINLQPVKKVIFVPDRIINFVL